MSLPLQQSPQFARTLKALNVPLASGAPVIVNRRFGFWGAVSFASRIAVEHLDTRPRIINAEQDVPDRIRAAGYRQIITPAHIARWDLSGENRHANMNGKWRNQLRKGMRSGLVVREIAWDGAPHWLFDGAALLAKERRFRPLPTHILSTYAQTNPQDAVIFEASNEDTPIAACLILRHGPSVTYQTAWTSDEGKALQAPKVLLEHAAMRATQWGHADMDLGLVETDTALGLARFKLGTGAKLVRLGGTWVRLGRSRPLAPAHLMA